MTVIINKSSHTLTLLDARGRAALSCPVMLSRGQGKKLREGDLRAPEGVYRVCAKNAQSKYHLALGLSYPNARDARRALSEGRVSRAQAFRIILADALRLRAPYTTPLGGYIMIHGEHPSGLSGDWTAGCFAVSNAHMDALFCACSRGDKVIVRP